ncbi:hypothetical protein ACE3MS_23250 [Paenibacillus dendritiformis]|uniref:hypothetical protein n=1 Tax=Paenibacillus dendritiformis TaxID=130049 RepID=UPI0036566541
MAQRKQKIEVRSITDDSVLHTITDNQQIFEFTKNLYIVRWKYLSSIPKDAKDLLVYVTWSEKTKTVIGNNSGELYETSRNTLYKNKDGYYLVIEPEPSLSPVRKVYSKVPAKTAEYLLSLCQGQKRNKAIAPASHSMQQRENQTGNSWTKCPEVDEIIGHNEMAAPPLRGS